LAAQVRSTFASAAVIPVIEPEITRAREAAVNSSIIPNLVERRDEVVASESYVTEASSTPSRPSNRGQVRPERRNRARHLRDARKTSNESDPLSESGVRHLKVQMQDPLSGRWRVIKLREAAEYLHLD